MRRRSPGWLTKEMGALVTDLTKNTNKRIVEFRIGVLSCFGRHKFIFERIALGYDGTKG